MNLALWIAAGVLAAISLGAGVNKLARTKEQLLANPQFAWAADFSQGQLRLAAVAELLAAVGLMLPQALGVATVLTPLAALGLTALQSIAAFTHLRRKEYPLVGLTTVLALTSLLVAVGRFAGLD